MIGAVNYVISYDYVLGADTLDDADEFYYNIIGTEWDTYIEDASFTITMPKEFDSDKLGFSTGSYGAEGTTNISYSAEGNTITGKILRTLYPYEGVTARLELPNGYFVFNEKRNTAGLPQSACLRFLPLCSPLLHGLNSAEIKRCSI